MYIYKLLDKNLNLLYVGKTKNINSRINQHLLDASKIKWKKEIETILVAKCKNDVDMDIYETYLINKLNPIHNISKRFEGEVGFILPDLEFYKYKKQNKKAQIDLPHATLGKLYQIYKLYNFLEFTAKDLSEMFDEDSSSTYKYIKRLLEHGFLIKLDASIYKINRDTFL